MSRFGLEFKSKGLPYGAERLRTDDSYNLGICSRMDCGRDGFPRIPKTSAKPDELQGFNFAKSTPSDQKRGKGCHFFIDDYQFERMWAAPRRVPGRPARLRLRPHARLQPLHGHARRDAGVEQVQERGAWLVLGAKRDDGRAHSLMGAAVQLPLLLQGHSQAFDRCHLHCGRGARQGSTESLARRHAGGHEAPGAVPRAPLRQEYRFRFRRLRGRRIQGRCFRWAVEVRLHLRGRQANGQEALAGRSPNHLKRQSDPKALQIQLLNRWLRPIRFGTPATESSPRTANVALSPTNSTGADMTLRLCQLTKAIFYRKSRITTRSQARSKVDGRARLGMRRQLTLERKRKMEQSPTLRKR